MKGLLSDERISFEVALAAAIPHGGPVEHYQRVADYPGRGGAKRIRPMLCLAVCRIYGGRPADAMPAAVALELLHSAFLVHDDIEDGSARRRGLPTMHESVGAARAINVGDSLSALALVALARGGRHWGGEVAGAVTTEFAHLMQRTTEGQARELDWIATDRYDLTDADYLALVRDKTCWYSTSHPLRIGGLIGSRGKADVDRLNDFGFYLGAVFQIHDDIENLESGSTYGKDVRGDIIEGKRTIPLLHLLRSAGTVDRSTVLGMVGPRGVGRAEERSAAVLELMYKYGSLDHARKFADALAGLALVEFRQLFAGFPASEPLEFMFDLVRDLQQGAQHHAETTRTDGVLADASGTAR
jgi:geranylgeranyl diphosphate synthase type II